MNRTLSVLFGLTCALSAAAAPLQSDAHVGHAAMSFDGKRLVVSTGIMTREWRLTDEGLATVGLSAGTEIPLQEARRASDWSLPGILPPGAHARLESLTAAPSDDDGFTTPHLAVDATFDYPGSGVTVRYSIWAYSDAPGLRTQLWLQGQPPQTVASSTGTVDCLPLSLSSFSRRYFGYYNDEQHRDDWSTPILRESTEPAEAPIPETIDWASAACFERPGSAVMLVKESQKCVKQAGVDTGNFIVSPDGVANTGLRLKAGDLKPDRLRWCWATWCLVYDGTDAGRELAIKRFYALRFPIDPKRDVYAQANTWGSGGWRGINSRDMAKESEVLPEIDSVADLGLDSLQIDSGWQDTGNPKTARFWRPDATLYPDGWRNVAARAAARGIGISLWAPSQVIPLKDMEWNYEQLHVRSWKLDFTQFHSADAIDTNIDKVRQYIAFTHHQSAVAWDTTEVAPRYGYYWAREYGCAWIANRKPGLPPNAVYKPDVLLRDLWQLAKYVNLNKVQVPVQIVETVDRRLSDAWRYNNLYSAAIGLTGIPCFFETTRLYSTSDRDQIRSLVAEWKRHRVALAQDTLFPVGDEPGPGGWAAFQFVDAGQGGGYFLIFRDVKSPDETRDIALRFASGKSLSVEDLRTHREFPLQADPNGVARFTIERPADFLFERYRMP